MCTSKNIKKAKEILKWKPKISLNEGLKITIDDYIRNVKEFNAKCGIGIRHKTSYSTISQLKKLGL